jgi:hypothetical protein
MIIISNNHTCNTSSCILYTILKFKGWHCGSFIRYKLSLLVVEKGLTNKLDIVVQENTKFQQDEISKVLDVTEEVELYLKEMLFIVEYGSEKQAFLLCRKIDKYLHQAGNFIRYKLSLFFF